MIKRAARANAIVCFEATGPYEEPLADECLAKGVRAVRLDAWGARRFAESQGRIEKTDRIDCEMIRDYAASLKDEKLHFIKPRSEAQKRLKKGSSGIGVGRLMPPPELLALCLWTSGRCRWATESVCWSRTA